MSLVYSAKRVQLSDLTCGIPSLRHSYVDVTSSIWVVIVLSVRKFFIHRYLLLCIPASVIFMKRPCLHILSYAFSRRKKKKDGNPF